MQRSETTYNSDIYRTLCNLGSAAVVGSSDKWHLVFLRTRTFVITARRSKNPIQLPSNYGLVVFSVQREFSDHFSSCFCLFLWSDASTVQVETAFLAVSYNITSLFFLSILFQEIYLGGFRNNKRIFVPPFMGRMPTFFVHTPSQVSMT